MATWRSRAFIVGSYCNFLALKSEVLVLLSGFWFRTSVSSVFRWLNEKVWSPMYKSYSCSFSNVNGMVDDPGVVAFHRELQMKSKEGCGHLQDFTMACRLSECPYRTGVVVVVNETLQRMVAMEL